MLEVVAWKMLSGQQVTQRLAVMVAASRLVWVPLLCMMALAALPAIGDGINPQLLIPELIVMALFPVIVGLVSATTPVLAMWFARSDI